SNGTAFFQILADTIQYTIDELNRFRTGEFPRNFERLVDDHSARRSGKAQQFGDGRAENVAINRRHTLHTPMLGVLFDQSVNFRGAIRGDTEKVFSKSLYVRIY